MFCVLTGFLALELNGERFSDEGLLLLVLMLTRHIHHLLPVWRGQEVQKEGTENKQHSNNTAEEEVNLIIQSRAKTELKTS